MKRERTLPTTSVQTQAHDQFRTRYTGSNVTLNSCMAIVSRLDERRSNVRRGLSIIFVQWGVMASLCFPTTYATMRHILGDVNA